MQQQERDVFYYHSDHLGCTSYITDRDSNATHSPTNDGTIVIQEHSAGHSSFDGDAAKPHFNIRRAEDTRHSSIPNTKEHYTFDK